MNFMVSIFIAQTYLECERESFVPTQVRSAVPSLTIPSDKKPREAKSTPCKRASYKTILTTKGSFISKFDFGITDVSKKLCRALLKTKQLVLKIHCFVTICLTKLASASEK